MRLTTYRDAGELLARAQRALEEDEAANSLLLGIGLRLRRAAREAPLGPYLATVAAKGELALGAVITLCCPVKVTGSTVASAIAGKRAQGPSGRPH